MSKIYISIYAPNSVHISNLYHQLKIYSERVNSTLYENNLEFHLTKMDIFNSNLYSQCIVYKKVYYFKYPKLSEHQLYIAICTFSSLILIKAHHDMEIFNFKI